MVLLDWVIRMKYTSEVQQKVQVAPWLITVWEDETNLLNSDSSVISWPNLIDHLNFPEVSNCETYCQIFPPWVSVQTVSDVIAETFGKIVHKLSSLKRDRRK